MGEQGEAVAVEMAATGAIGQRLDKLDESFLMALDYMIQQADRDDKVLVSLYSCSLHCQCPWLIRYAFL
jgi:hypothetical protein